MLKINVEYTDTFGGESNYSWVEREEFYMSEDSSDLAIFRKAKSIIGLSGVRGRKDDYGGYIAFYPYRMCTVLFVDIISEDESALCDSCSANVIQGLLCHEYGCPNN